MKQVISFFLPVIFFLITTVVSAQSTGIGTPTPNASSVLDVSSNSKGLLIPRMGSAQRKAIVLPATGLMVYDLDKNTVYMYDGAKWQPLLFSTNENSLPPAGRTVSDGAANDQLGTTVSINGNYAIVGALVKSSLLPPNPTDNKGAAYIFFRNGTTWVQQAKLFAADLSIAANFGTSVSINGDYAVVGAAANDVGTNAAQGSAYIYRRTGSTWTQQAKITAADGAAGDNFGRSVSISGDYVIAGSSSCTISGNTRQGAAYIFFKGAAWTTGQAYQSKLIANDGAANDFFGTSVCIDGDYVIVGAIANLNKGAAYIYGRIGASWLGLAKLTADDGAVNDFFGYSVGLSGDYAIVGSHSNDINGNTDQGSAYIFFRNTGWVSGQPYQAKLTAVVGAPNDHYGIAVNISSDYALAGAYGQTVNSTIEQGAGYLYKRNGNAWNLVRRIDDGSGMPGGYFGFSLAMQGFNIIIGAFGKNNSQGEISFLNIE